MKGCMTSLKCLWLILVFGIISNGIAEQQSTFTGRLIKASPAISKHMQAKATSYQVFKFDIERLASYASQERTSLNLDLDFGSSGRWSLELEEYDPRSPGYVLQVGTATGIQSLAPQPTITWRGTLSGEADSDVRMTLSGDFFRLFIKHSDGQQYYIESLPTARKSGANIIALYDISDLIEQDRHCQTASPSGLATIRNLERQEPHLQKDAACQQAELAIIVDYLAFEKADGGVAELEAELLTILNLTNAYFEELELEYKLVETFISTDQQNDPWVNIGADAGALLDKVDEWVGGGNMQHWHDLATFYTGHELGFSYAWVGSVGTYWRHHLVEYWGSNNDVWMAKFVAHESGHNWGAGHVERSNQWIMSPTLYGGTLTWHTTTRSNFPGYINDVSQHMSDCDGVVTSTEEPPASLLDGFELAQNFPNPFNPATQISFTLPAGQSVKLSVFDVSGQLIAVILNDFRDAGTHEMTFQADDLSGGLYFYRIQAGPFTQTRKMMLVR